MRVIAGEFRSRKLSSVPGIMVRPTPDRLRESLFNILQGRIEDAVFADLYAGSGAVGIEALSRGARRAVFVEKHRDAVAVIEANLKSLGLGPRAAVLKRRAADAVAKLEADIVFLDPPFDEPKEFPATLEALGETAHPLVIVQHPPRIPLLDAYGTLHRVRTVKQGDNWLSFYER